MLALNIVHRPFSGLFHQLDFLQGAPLGFLLLEKLAVNAFGNNEYSLRLVALIAGSLAVLLSLFLAREVVAPAAVPLVVLLVAVSDPLILWTTYAKPYAVDVLVTVVVLWSGLLLLRRTDGLRAPVLFAAIGAGAIWLSHASVFVLAGVSTALVGGAVIRREWRRALVLSVASASWPISFGVFAFTLLGNLSGLQRLQCATCFPGDDGSSGTSAASLSGLHSLRGSLGEFRYMAGVPHFLERGGNDAGLLVFFIALAFCLVGLVSLARHRPEVAVCLVAPLIFMLAAWSFHKYPTLGRTQLFLVPNFLLLLGEGMIFLVANVRRVPLRVFFAAGAALVCITIASRTLGHITHPRRFEEMKPVLNDIAVEQKPGDTIFVYYYAEYALRYYLECQCTGRALEAAQVAGLWPNRPGPGGRSEWAPALLSVPPRFVVPPYRGTGPSNYAGDFGALRGRKRVWVLVSNLTDAERNVVHQQLDVEGTRVATFMSGASNQAVVAAYLYDMTRPTNGA